VAKNVVPESRRFYFDRQISLAHYDRHFEVSHTSSKNPLKEIVAANFKIRINLYFTVKKQFYSTPELQIHINKDENVSKHKMYLTF
jgi:hypothetical protein